MEIIVFFFGIVISVIFHFVFQKIFIKFNKFDDFNFRSSHKTLATRTGGIGVFSTLFIISLFFYFQGIEIFDYSLFIPLSIMFIVGVYDDLYNADFKLKFFMQIIVAKLLIDQGYAIVNFHGLFGINEISWILAQLSTVFVFLVVVNGINFIDGIDGLAITEAIKLITIIELFSNKPTMLVNLGAIVIASLIPLYYFNFRKRSKVFLGDGGSLLLGCLIMIYLLYLLGPDYKFSEGYRFNKFFFSILILLYPLIDLLRVFIIRLRDGQSPFKPDQKHIHHFLFKKFKSAPKTILIIQTITTAIIFTYIFLK